MNEMKFLEQFESHNKTQAVIHRCQKIFDFLNGTTYPNHVKIPDLTLEEKILLDYINNHYSDNHDGQKIDFSKYMDSSMVITFENIVVKIIYVDDYDFNYIPYEYDYPNLIPMIDSNNTTRMTHNIVFVISREGITGNNFISTMFDIINRFFNKYAANFFNTELFGFPDFDEKAYIDIYIIKIRLLDSLFDLKYDDYKLIHDECNNKYIEREIYNFAITSGATVKEYENMLINIFSRFKFGSDNLYNEYCCMEPVIEYI